MSDIHEVDEVIITGRRNSNGWVTLYWQLQSRNTLTPESSERMDRNRVLPNAVIRIIDTTGTLPKIEFLTPLPPEALQVLIDVLTVYANNMAGLSATDQEALGDLMYTFTNMKLSNIGLRFEAKDLPRDTLMQALTRSDGAPTLKDGFFTIQVNPDLVTNPRYYGEQLRTIVPHELLHLNPQFEIAARNRFTNNGARPFDVNRYNPWHQHYYESRASRMLSLVRGSIRNLQRALSTVEGGATAQSLVGTDVFNDLIGGGGNDTFTSSGAVDFLWGGSGDDKYVYTTNSGVYIIHDDGGTNTLEIQGPYSTANLRVGAMANRYLIGVVADPQSKATAFDLERYVSIPRDGTGAATIQRVIVGGTTYLIPSLAPLSNGAPEFDGPIVFDVQQAQFNLGNIGYVSASDLDGDALTYSVVSVTGLGSSSTWSFSGNLLKTTYRNPGVSGFSAVTVKVSDGFAEDTKIIRVNWISRVRPTG